MISLKIFILFFWKILRSWIHRILTNINLYFFLFFEIFAYYKVTLFNNELYWQTPFLNFGFCISWIIFKISICISSAHCLAFFTVIWIRRKTFLFLNLNIFLSRAVSLSLNSGIDIFSFCANSILCNLCILLSISISCSSPHFFFNLYDFRNLKHTFRFCIITKIMTILVNHIAQSYIVVYLLLEIRSTIIRKSWLDYKIFPIFCFHCFYLFLYTNKSLLIFYCCILFIIFLHCSFWSTLWSFWLIYWNSVLWICWKNSLSWRLYF